MTVAGQGLSVTFGSVLSDTRCPPQVQCITAGNATISVTLRKDGMVPATVQLNTVGGGSSSSFGGYTIALVSLGYTSPAVARFRIT